MVATTSHACIKVPGLNQRITDRHCIKSSKLYNTLPEILEVSDRGQLPDSIVDKIGRLITESGLGDYIGIHETHSHGGLADDLVIIGKDCDKPICRRMQQVRLSEVDSSKIHGRLFVLDDDDHLYPYEYQQGTIPENIQELVSKFIPRYIDYVKTHNLGRTISLEILSEIFRKPLSEIVCGSEVTMWESDRVVQRDQTRTTGWRFSPEGPSDSSNWVGTSEGHKKIVPPPDSKLPDVQELEAQLVREGVLMYRD